MAKIGRNDPCPSGAGVKFKKCLAQHPQLGPQCTAADLWWICSRWQAPPPPAQDLLQALARTTNPDPDKRTALLDLALASAPGSIPWAQLFAAFHEVGHPDLPGLYRLIVASHPAGSDPRQAFFLATAVKCLREDHPGMYSVIIRDTLALDPAHTPAETLVDLAAWAIDLDRLDHYNHLREHFSSFPTHLFEDPEEDQEDYEDDDDEEDFDDDEEDDEEEEDSKVPPEVRRELQRIWAEFEAVETPSVEEIEALLEALLAQPHEATDWSEVFECIRELDPPDLFRLFDRMTSALSHPDIRDLAFLYWGAVAVARDHCQPERMPEIVRGFFALTEATYDPDALSHIVENLLAQGFVAECLELIEHFFPILSACPRLMSWVLPRVAEDIFLIRLGLLISSGLDSAVPADQLAAELCGKLGEELDPNKVTLVLQHLTQHGDATTFTRSRFHLPSTRTDSDDPQSAWTGLLGTFLDVVRNPVPGAQHPSVTLLGLQMILRAAEDWLASPREKGQKYPNNLLGYFQPEAIDRLVGTECSEFLGPNMPRACIMLGAYDAFARWAAQHGLIEEREGAKAIKKIEELLEIARPRTLAP